MLRFRLCAAGLRPLGLVLQFGAKILVASHGLTQTDVRGYLWLPPLAFDVGAVTFGVLGTLRARRRGGAPSPPRALFAMAAVLCVAVGLMALASTPWQTTIAASIALAGGGGVYALATPDMLSRVPAEQVAAASGITAAAQSLALIVAFPLIGRAVPASGSYHGVALALAVWLVPGALVWLAVRPGASGTSGASGAASATSQG